MKNKSKKFLDDSPCAKGHISEKYSNPKRCVQCVRENSKKWHDSNHKKIIKGHSQYYHKNKDKFREYSLLKLYKITSKDYKIMLENQNNVCAICEKPETALKNGKVKSFAIDHDHLTGKIRGLLCSKCNRGIGYFKDSKILLSNAIEYLEKNK